MREYPELLPALAAAVEKLRRERKLTKLSLAVAADLQDCYVRGITKGRRNPTITAIYSICDALNVSPLEFFHAVEEERKRVRTS